MQLQRQEGVLASLQSLPDTCVRQQTARLHPATKVWGELLDRRR